VRHARAAVRTLPTHGIVEIDSHGRKEQVVQEEASGSLDDRNASRRLLWTWECMEIT
jgi:hypothetical protein